MARLWRPLAAGLVFVAGATNVATAGQPDAAGWQRKGASATPPREAAIVPAKPAMPRPFDDPSTGDEGGSTSIAAPWAAPVAQRSQSGTAPLPMQSPTRIRHVAGSTQSPGGPLKWKVRDGQPTESGRTTKLAGAPIGLSPIRRTNHLQDAPQPLHEVDANEQVELNSPRAEEDEPRVAQGRDSSADPAIPPTPPREAAPQPRSGVRSTESAPELRPIPRTRESDLNMLRDIPCERMYGPDANRNCCAEELLCAEARKRVKQLTIGRINVDITPTCNLAGEWSDAPETKCGWQLEASPIRAWKDRIGQEITVGRFSGFANARVIITGEDGKLTKVKLHDLGEDERCFVTAWCGLPFECGLVDEPIRGRYWEPITMTWQASGLCHKPLYFEDAQLERYGHTFGPAVQPFVSGAHFFANIALLPYNMGIHPMRECQYSLGYYRPGSCAPRMIPPFPWSVRGGLMEAGVLVGGVYLIP